MRASLKAALAGTAAVLIGAAALPATAQTRTHTMTVQLPNGAVEQIVYAGDVAPQIVLAPGAAAPADPFAMLDRIAAMLDRQTAGMFESLAALPAPGETLPAGMSGTTLVSTFSGNGVCTRSVRITYDGSSATPRQVSSMSGDCDSQPDGQVPAALARPARPAMPGTIEVGATRPVGAQRLGTPSAAAYRQLVQPTAWQH